MDVDEIWEYVKDNVLCLFRGEKLLLVYDDKYKKVLKVLPDMDYGDRYLLWEFESIEDYFKIDKTSSYEERLELLEKYGEEFREKFSQRWDKI